MLLGDCQERRGLIASAWATYRQAASHFRQHGDARSEEAKLRAAKLQVQVPRLTLEATKVPGLTIVRGDTRFDEGVLGVALAVDPGKHRIEARAPGYEPWVGEVTIRASERKSLLIPALEPKSEPKQPALTASAAPSEHGAWWTAGLITGAAGLVTVGVGALLGGLAAADVNQAEEDPTLCGPSHVCTPRGREVIDRADRLAIGSTVLVSAGGAALVAGFVMALLDEPKPSEESAWVAPLMGPTEAGLSIGGRF
jgi:hypothetical protein